MTDHRSHRKNRFMHAPCFIAALIGMLYVIPASAEEREWALPMEDPGLPFDVLEMEAKRATLSKLEDCMRAFGGDRFCTCLATKLPIALDFGDYILATINTRQELGYDDFNETEKKMIDLARDVRDECVADSKETRLPAKK